MSQVSTRVAELLIEEHISSDLHFHTVRVFLVDEPLVVGVGTSARNPADKYNANKGYRLALKRALADLMNAHARTERRPVKKWTAEEIENARLAKLQTALNEMEPKPLDQVYTPQDRLEAGYLAGKREPRMRGESYSDWVRRTSPRG